MSPVVHLARSRLRRTWVSAVVLGLLMALGIGAGLACIAGARRTASSFERIADASAQPTITASHGEPPAKADAIAAGLSGVAEHSSVIGFQGFVEELDPTLIKYFIGAWNVPLMHGRPAMLSGRAADPSRADEVMVVGPAVERGGIAPGDVLTVQLFTLDFSSSVRQEFTVTGVGSDVGEVAADSAANRSAIYFTPAFSTAHEPALRQWSATRLVVADGTSIDELAAQIVEVGWPVDETIESARTRVQDAVRPLTLTLALLGALIISATILVAGQALARQLDSRRGDRLALRAMGLTWRQVSTLDLLAVLTIGVPAVVLAVVAAIAASPLFPIGTVRRLEPERGIDVDLTVLALGAIATLLVLLSGHWFASRRHEAPVRPAALPALASAGSRVPALATGVRLAVGGTNVQRRRFWTTLGFSALALALVVAGTGFVTSLDRVSEDSTRYGVGWELTAKNAYGVVVAEDVAAMVAGDADVVGTAGATVRKMLLDDRVIVPGLIVMPFTADIWPTIIEGRAPKSEDEVLVGARVLQQLDKDVGDTVRLESQDSPGGASPLVTIVGTAVLPSLEIPGVDSTRLSSGIVVAWGQYVRLTEQGPSTAPAPDITFFDLADGVDVADVIARYPEGVPERTGFVPTEWLESLAPAEVIETDKATPLIWTVVAFLAIVVLAMLGHAIVSTLRRRRGTYAILTSIGFTRRQLAATVASQSLVTTLVALIIGLPVGVIIGRVAWRSFARGIGLVDTPVLPVVPLVVIVAAALLGATIVGLAPSMRVARRSPSAVLRGE